MVIQTLMLFVLINNSMFVAFHSSARSSREYNNKTLVFFHGLRDHGCWVPTTREQKAHVFFAVRFIDFHSRRRWAVNVVE